MSHHNLDDDFDKIGRPLICSICHKGIPTGDQYNLSNNEITCINCAQGTKTTTEIIREMEKQYPNMFLQFQTEQGKGYDLFCVKNHDYGPDNIKSGTTLETEEDKRFALMGVWFRMNDKMMRLKNLLFNKTDAAVKDESLEDTFTDLANYATICKVVMSGKWGK